MNQSARKIFISHQQQCDLDEIKKLVSYLIKLGFEVEHGSLRADEFAQFLATADSYVCILERDTYKSQEISREIATACSQGISIFAIFCPSITDTITVPNAIEDFATGVTEWNIEKLVDGIGGKDIGFVDQFGKPKEVTVKTKKPPCD